MMRWWWWCESVVLAGAVRPVQDFAGLNREDAFQELFRRYFAHYRNGTNVRSMPGLEAHEIPIQYEFEVPKPMYDLTMTPELLLMRGGISSPDFVLGPAFNSTSPWWHIEVDGLGGKHHQVIQALPEANSVVVRPRTVLNSTLPNDLVRYFQKLKVPQSVHKQSFQFTLGVPLERISDLMKRTPAMKERLDATAQFCTSNATGGRCSGRYEGVLLLCQMVLDQATTCSACGFPKRCQTPWLLRTHIGDLTRSLEKNERDRLMAEVLQLLGGDRQLYPKGIMDYLHFPEMAEMGGMVKTRLGAEEDVDELPTQLGALLDLAAKMLQHREQVDQRLRGRPCRVNAAPSATPWAAPTAAQWLQGAQEGRDLMSDHDSLASKASLSSTLWRSMGSWRWTPQEPRIFLECRHPVSCLGFDHNSWNLLGYEEMLTEAARMAHDLEEISD